MNSKLNLAAPNNANYAATVFQLKDFIILPNCDNIKAAIIYGNSVIVAKNSEAGSLGLFFPVETKLSDEFLGANNLFRKPEWGNVDPAGKGFFEQHGRIRCVKFRGHKSEGFWLPLESLHYTGMTLSDFNIGDTFDQLGEHEICRKYVPLRRAGNAAPVRGKVAKLEDSIVDGQFRFHFDTENLRRNAHKIQPTDFISISDKFHGTSVVIGKLLVKRNLSWYERILRKIGVQIVDSNYGLTYSSRRVIKAVNGVTKASNHYYSTDIWGQVAKEVEDKIPNGFTLYGEIVGYTGDGKEIQKGYAYGCLPGAHKLVVYRVTFTNEQGIPFELPWPQMNEFGSKYGFEIVPTLYYGLASNFYQMSGCSSGPEDTWNKWFLNELESVYVRDGDCPYNVKGTPAEGIVVRIDRLNECESFKLKSFRFLEQESKQLDKGEADIETAESVQEEEAVCQVQNS